MWEMMVSVKVGFMYIAVPMFEGVVCMEMSR